MFAKSLHYQGRSSKRRPDKLTKIAIWDANIVGGGGRQVTLANRRKSSEGRAHMSNQFIGARQTTIAREIEVTGTGVHSGAPVSVILHPAAADTGLRFLVTKRGRVVAEIPASVEHVKNLTLCTVLGNDAGITVGTVEHLLAALRGLAVDNCVFDRQQRSADHGRELGSLRRSDRRDRHPRAAGTPPLHQGLEADPRTGRRKLGRTSSPRRLPRRRRNRLPHPADRQAAPLLRNEPGVFRHEISRARTSVSP